MPNPPDLTVFGSLILIVVVELAKLSRNIDISKFPDVIDNWKSWDMILHRFVWFHYLNSFLIFYTIYMLLFFDNFVNRILSAFLFAVWVALPAIEIEEYYYILNHGRFPNSLAYHLFSTSLIYAIMVIVLWRVITFPISNQMYIIINGVSIATIWLHVFIFLAIVRRDFEDIDTDSGDEKAPRDL